MEDEVIENIKTLHLISIVAIVLLSIGMSALRWRNKEEKMWRPLIVGIIISIVSVLVFIGLEKILHE